MDDFTPCKVVSDSKFNLISPTTLGFERFEYRAKSSCVEIFKDGRVNFKAKLLVCKFSVLQTLDIACRSFTGFHHPVRSLMHINVESNSDVKIISGLTFSILD